MASCSDPAAPGSDGPPGLTIVAGAGVADTAMAVLPQALIVEVRDSRGRPARGAEVRFTGVPADPARPNHLSVLSRPIDFPYARPEAVDTTDGDGRARVQVQLGMIAGSGRLAVRVPSTGAVDTARFTVRPGNAARLVADVQDTTIAVQDGFRLGVRVSDRWGNALDDAPVSFAASGDGVSVDAAGNVSTTVPARGFIVASTGALADTARLSVVPPGTFCAVHFERTSGFQLVTLQLDGTGVRTLAILRDNPARPSWHPAGDQIVFEDLDPDSRERLYIVDMQGQRRRAVAPVAGLHRERSGRFSPDGQWLYFDGYNSDIGYGTSWRALADGSGAEPVPLPPGVTATGQPDPSPDGVHLAVSGLAVQDLAGTRMTRLPALGIYPRYSPDGSRLLYSSQVKSLSVVNADGTGARELVATHGYDPAIPPSWSADGNWILIRGPSRLELVRVSTGEIIPLTYSVNLYQPALRR